MDILFCGNDKVFDGVLTAGLSIVRRLDAPRPLNIHIFTMELTRVPGISSNDGKARQGN